MSSTPEVLPQYIAALCSTLGAFAMGGIIGYSSPAGAILLNNTNTDNPNLILNEDEISWFSSVSNLGALFGGPIAGFCINILGRRGTMIYSVIPVMIGWVLIAAAQNFPMLLIGRIISGSYCGIISLTVPTYIGEYASPHIRGGLASGFQLMCVTGILFAYCMGAAFPDNFRWIAGMCAIFPVVFSALMIFNKESPSYLVSKGKNDEARTALRYFRGKNYDGIEKEIQDITDSQEQSRLKKATLKDLLTPYILKPFLMSLGLMFFQQFSGINAVLFNLTTIFEDAGTSISATLSSIIIAITQVVATLAALLIIDKAGRKILLLISSCLMMVSLVALGIFFYIKEKDPETAESLGWLPLVSLIVFIAAFSIGYGPIPWVMMGELFSSEIKELAASIATMTNWGCAFIVTLIFAPLQSAIYDYGVYWFFAGFCVLNFIFVLTFVYETKGKSLQEITIHFGGPPPSAAPEKEGQKNVDFY